MLARKYAISSLLRGAFYELVRLDVPSRTIREKLAEGGAEATLSAPDFDLVNAVHVQLRMTWQQICLRPPPFLQSACPVAILDRETHVRCEDERANIAVTWPGYLGDMLHSSDPIVSCDQGLEIKWQHELGFCEGCALEIVHFWRETKKDLWVRLGAWLNLDDPPRETEHLSTDRRERSSDDLNRTGPPSKRPRLALESSTSRGDSNSGV